jgi:hypothetical protein
MSTRLGSSPPITYRDQDPVDRRNTKQFTQTPHIGGAADAEGGKFDIILLESR